MGDLPNDFTVSSYPHCLWIKRNFCLKTEISPGWLSKKNIFLEIKNASANFLFQGFYIKRHFDCAFDDNLSVIHVFIKQIFRAAEKAPPSPDTHTHSTVQGEG
jgi:hypothetical protein